MNIVEIKTPELIERCFPLFRELRTELSFSRFIQLFGEASEHNGYRLVGVEEDRQFMALMGYRILFDFVHGKHLYVDDLVVASSRRSSGIGAQLLKHAELLARESGCQGLRLCTGNQNTQAMKFYERNGWSQRAVVFKKVF